MALLLSFAGHDRSRGSYEDQLSDEGRSTSASNATATLESSGRPVSSSLREAAIASAEEGSCSSEKGYALQNTGEPAEEPAADTDSCHRSHPTYSRAAFRRAAWSLAEDVGALKREVAALQAAHRHGENGYTFRGEWSNTEEPGLGQEIVGLRSEVAQLRDKFATFSKSWELSSCSTNVAEVASFSQPDGEATPPLMSLEKSVDCADNEAALRSGRSINSPPGELQIIRNEVSGVAAACKRRCCSAEAVASALSRRLERTGERVETLEATVQLQDERAGARLTAVELTVQQLAADVAEVCLQNAPQSAALIDMRQELAEMSHVMDGRARREGTAIAELRLRLEALDSAVEHGLADVGSRLEGLDHVVGVLDFEPMLAKMQDCIRRLDSAESATSPESGTESQEIGLKNSDSFSRLYTALEKRQNALERRQAETERLHRERSRRDAESESSIFLSQGGLEALEKRQDEVERLWQEELSARRIANAEQSGFVQAFASLQEEVERLRDPFKITAATPTQVEDTITKSEADGGLTTTSQTFEIKELYENFEALEKAMIEALEKAFTAFADADKVVSSLQTSVYTLNHHVVSVSETVEHLKAEQDVYARRQDDQLRLLRQQDLKRQSRFSFRACLGGGVKKSGGKGSH